MPRKYTDEDLIREFPNATSIADLMRRIGIGNGTSASTYVKNHLLRLGLDPETIKNQGYRMYTRMSNEDIFCNPTKYKSPSNVRQKALDAGLLENKCYICGQLPEWNGKPMVLILDHIDGNNQNNLPDNLRIVCPNCDTQLPTFKGRNATYDIKQYFCEDCGKNVTRRAKRCIDCENKRKRTFEWPDRTTLKALIRTESFASIGKLFESAPSTIRSICKYYDLPNRKQDIIGISDKDWEDI